MPILAVGSVSFDTIYTPKENVDEVLGGSATYFLMTASYYDSVEILAVVGDDFPRSWLALLGSQAVDPNGLRVVPGKTFRWAARYLEDWNHRQTLHTDLNVFAAFRPVIPIRSPLWNIVFLANMQPELQFDVLNQVERASANDSIRMEAADKVLFALDSGDLWIQIARQDLIEVLRRVDIVLLNDEEVRLFTGAKDLETAAHRILDLGPRWIVVKQGSFGVSLFTATGEDLIVPGYPLAQTRDPTGAGDAFAGGFLGYLSRQMLLGSALTVSDFRNAVIHGSIMGSFACEDFSIGRLCLITPTDITTRFHEFVNIMGNVRGKHTP